MIWSKGPEDWKESQVPHYQLTAFLLAQTMHVITHVCEASTVGRVKAKTRVNGKPPFQGLLRNSVVPAGLDRLIHFSQR